MKLTKAKLQELFRELAARLLDKGVEGEIGVVGGAAMVLAYDARVATKDVDAIFQPSGTIRRAAQRMAAEHGLPGDWLNGAVKAFMPKDPKERIAVFDAPGFRVWMPEPEYLLAMKAISSRIDTNDAEDLRLLIGKLGLSSSDDVLAIVERYYPEKQVPVRMKFFVEELFAEPTFVERAAKTPIQWRPCPAGQHWRKAHFQPMYKTKTGKVVRGHKVSEGCCDNPANKDQIYEEELKLIAKKFVGLSGAPTANELGFVGKGNRYDELIRGWTRFWNDTLKPEDPLDPNLVKALIASESGFDRDPKRGSRIAKGLMQITNGTRKSLGGFKDELKDHLVHVDQKNILDPTLNIAAGTRWLFQKKHLAGRHLKRMATWDEAVAEYKRYLQDIVKDPTKTPAGMKVFRDFYRTLGGK